jgi:membrane protease YdiL (CAAX protease family)
LLAWAAMLLMSRLPQIVLKEFWALDIHFGWWLLATSALFIAATFIWSPARPLRGYFLIMAAIALCTSLLDAPVRNSAAWQSWFGADKGWAINFFGERLPLVMEALAIILVLRLMGLKRSDFFLVKGNLSTPASRLPTLLTLGLAVLFALGLSQLMPPPPDWSQALAWLPAILLFALMNAFGEEMVYRAAPLSQLVPVISQGQANWITAVWFGLGHFYGGFPDGPLGAGQAALVGLLFGKAMLATKGMALPVLLHIVVDMVIYLFLAMAAVTAGTL